MHPSAEDVMNSIVWTFDEEIAPDLSSGRAKSLALTTSNLLRHVLLRMQREAPALWEDNRELRGLLAQAADFFSTVEDGARRAEEIRGVLERQYVAPGAYCGMAEIEKQAFDLGMALDRAVEYLHALRQRFGSDAGYLTLRAAVREYLEKLLKREALWIDEAFVNTRR